MSGFSFKQKYEQLLVLAKEAKNAALAPVRAAETKRRLEHELSKVDIAIAEKENVISELVGEYPMNVDKVIELRDDIVMLEIRKDNITKMIAELF